MLNNIAIYTTKNVDHDRKIIELYKFLDDVAPYSVALNPDSKKLRNAHVFIGDYRREFLNLDDSNKLIFLCRDRIANKHWLLMPSVDVIITNSLYEGLHVSWQLQSKRFNKHVVHLPPWSIPRNLVEGGIYYSSLDERFKNAFFRRELQNTNPNAPIRVSLSDSATWPYDILEGMLSGAVSIVLDRPPFNEFIIHGHNGFLVRNPGDVVGALQKIDDNKHWIMHNAKASIRALLEPTRYLNSLLNPEALPTIRLDPKPIEYSQRKWIIRERAFQAGQINYFPEKFNPNFTEIDLIEVQEILEYFLTQEFSDVYIFGCDIPEILEKREEVQLMRMITKTGGRSMRIHFCREEPIPQSWEKIFARLSTISVEEGLKQVSN